MVPLANSAPLALSFLFQRLKWPVPMSRWRAAKEIRNLLDNPVTRSSATHTLLDYLDGCKTESEICAILSIVFLTSPDGRPTRRALILRIHCPSILADIILERIYGPGEGVDWWRSAHSGAAPGDFEGGSYFEKHKTAHAPPILGDNLARLERRSGLPFQRQWAYEWRSLRDKLGTYYTRYPHYFDDVSEARAGILGQYWQRMREVFLSAYLRTLAYAVGEWGLPQNMAELYCLDIVHGVGGLFEVDPGSRPTWLSDIPERFCSPDSDFVVLVRELVEQAKDGKMRLVSLDTPVASSVKNYAKLSVTAHLVTPDYELSPSTLLFEEISLLVIDKTFHLKGPPAANTVEQASTEGVKGHEVSVCNALFPIPFGSWQSDYISMRLPIPAPYIVSGTQIVCTGEGIDLQTADGALVSYTRPWNDNWVPPHPKEGSTRCGVATMMEAAALDEAQVRLGRRLAFFVRLRIWDREKEYGDYFESERKMLVVM